MALHRRQIREFLKSKVGPSLVGPGGGTDHQGLSASRLQGLVIHGEQALLLLLRQLVPGFGKSCLPQFVDGLCHAALPGIATRPPTSLPLMPVLRETGVTPRPPFILASVVNIASQLIMRFRFPSPAQIHATRSRAPVRPGSTSRRPRRGLAPSSTRPRR